jgi:hypothetical protein
VVGVLLLALSTGAAATLAAVRRAPPRCSNVDALSHAYEASLEPATEVPSAPHRRPLGGPLARMLRTRR